MTSNKLSKKQLTPLNKRHSAGQRFALLAAMGETVFHAGDIANLWNIHNKNTLYTTLVRYQNAGMLYRIYKGLYSLKKINDIDPRLLGVKALHIPAYISCESVLFDSGVINQPPREITLVSGLSKRFTIAGYKFRSRKLKDAFLYNDAGIKTVNGFRLALPERAAADMLYFSPKKYLDAFGSKIINWKQVRSINSQIGYPKLKII
jgi:predicted transcriptional regulator of viral defense system